MEKEIAIHIKDLVVSYRDIKKFSIRKTLFNREKSSLFTAIKGISFDIKKGEIVGICGKNGSGKSTLLRAIAGIFSADKGIISLNGNTVSLLSIGDKLAFMQNDLFDKLELMLKAMYNNLDFM